MWRPSRQLASAIGTLGRMAQVDPDQLAALRRLPAAFGHVDAAMSSESSRVSGLAAPFPVRGQSESCPILARDRRPSAVLSRVFEARATPAMPKLWGRFWQEGGVLQDSPGTPAVPLG